MLQSVDPLFPIGSYAHSYGFEEYVALTNSSGKEDLLEFMSSVVQLNLEQFELPYLRFSYIAQESGIEDEIAALDNEIGAAKLSREIRLASSAQGKQRLRLLEKIRSGSQVASLSKLAGQGKIVPHHITVFAAERLQLDTPLEAALVSWAYQAFAAPCAASLKIMRIGQDSAQWALTRALSWIPSIVEESLQIEREWAGAFNPFIDIASDRHERAYARLFIS